MSESSPESPAVERESNLDSQTIESVSSPDSSALEFESSPEIQLQSICLLHCRIRVISHTTYLVAQKPVSCHIACLMKDLSVLAIIAGEVVLNR